jgi:hypothetical protein
MCGRIEHIEDIEPIGIQYGFLVAWNCRCGTTRCLNPAVDDIWLVDKAVAADKRAGRWMAPTR